MSEHALSEELQPLEVELRRIERDYTRRGLKFYLQPGRDLMPEFLQGQRPDAIAEKAAKALRQTREWLTSQRW
jgi:hypothetical protein